MRIPYFNTGEVTPPLNGRVCFFNKETQMVEMGIFYWHTHSVSKFEPYAGEEVVNDGNINWFYSLFDSSWPTSVSWFPIEGGFPFEGAKFFETEIVITRFIQPNDGERVFYTCHDNVDNITDSSIGTFDLVNLSFKVDGYRDDAKGYSPDKAEYWAHLPTIPEFSPRG
ncbi:MAG: hypothetical protein GY928_34115 [Colwellia sp.]|nr:hypothetical protein [Colwellia sp.]